MKKTKAVDTGSSVCLPIVLTSFLIIELFLFTWCRVQSVNNGYMLSHEKKNLRELAELQKSLTIELAHLKAPQMIESYARKKLALASPGPDQIITIKTR